MGQFGEENHPIAIDFINCNGSEERVINCDRSRDGRASCGRFEDAGIVCQGMYLLEQDVKVLGSLQSSFGLTN